MTFLNLWQRWSALWLDKRRWSANNLYSFLSSQCSSAADRLSWGHGTVYTSFRLRSRHDRKAWRISSAALPDGGLSQISFVWNTINSCTWPTMCSEGNSTSKGRFNSLQQSSVGWWRGVPKWNLYGMKWNLYGIVLEFKLYCIQN